MIKINMKERKWMAKMGWTYATLWIAYLFHSWVGGGGGFRFNSSQIFVLFTFFDFTFTHAGLTTFYYFPVCNLKQYQGIFRSLRTPLCNPSSVLPASKFRGHENLTLIRQPTFAAGIVKCALANLRLKQKPYARHTVPIAMITYVSMSICPWKNIDSCIAQTLHNKHFQDNLVQISFANRHYDILVVSFKSVSSRKLLVLGSE